MLPILEAFHKGQGRQVRIDSLKRGDRAIILSLNFVGAIVIEVHQIDAPTRPALEPTWVSGIILAPEHLAYASIRAGERVPMTFNRQGDALALPITEDEFRALTVAADAPPTVV